MPVIPKYRLSAASSLLIIHFERGLQEIIRCASRMLRESAMQLEMENAELRLARHAAIRLQRQAVRILCRAGSVWVTRDHDRRDLVLHAGDVYQSIGLEDLIVSALENARVAIERPSVEQPARRPGARLAA
jgi:hypothetical protein